MGRKLLFLVVGIGLVWSVSPANSALILWDEPLPVDVPLAGGKVLEAINLGGPAVANVGGVDFAAGDAEAAAPQYSNIFDELTSSWGGPTGAGDFVTDPGLAQVVSTARWTDDDEMQPLQLINLEPGVEYTIQLYTGDQRSCCLTRGYIFEDGLGNASAVWTRGSLTTLVGHFTADATVQDIPMFLAADSSDPHLTGYVLTPEPTTIALLGLGTMALRRRRRS